MSNISQSPLLFLVHGFRDSAEGWAGVRASLTERGWNTAALTLSPGSTDLDSTQVLEAYAQQVLKVLRESKASTTRVVLVGHSMGAQVAELAAQQLPADELAALVLVTPAPLGGYRLTEEQHERFVAGTAETDPERIAAGRRALAPSVDDAAIANLVDASLRTAGAIGLEQLKAWTGGHPQGQGASAVIAPVTVVATDQDAFFTPELLAESVVPRFANGGLEVVRGAGHWPHVERPVEIADVVDAVARSI